MKKIYSYHTSSDSYWESRFYEHEYFLCETDEEYKEQWQKAIEMRDERKKRADEAQNKYFADAIRQSLVLMSEDKVHASEYYYCHEWNGRSFDAIGFGVFEHLERSDHYRYYLKPGSVKNECNY